MKGFTFPYRGNDVFIVTDKPRKSRGLIVAALRQIGADTSDAQVKVTYEFTRRAECEVKTLPLSGRQYFDIHGAGFGGWGYFLDEGKTIIVKI